MEIKNTNKTFLSLIPVIAFVPIIIQITNGFHLGGANIIINFLSGAFKPSLERTVLISSWNGLQTTIAIAIISWTLSIGIGLGMGIASSGKIYKVLGIPTLIANIIRRLLNVGRATHEIIWGMLFMELFGLEPWIAILAIAIPYSCLMARVFGEQIDNQNFETLVAIRETGAGNLALLITSLVPKLIPLVGIYGSYRFECAIRGATILGLFGLGGIGTELQLSMMSLKFNEIWTSLWMLFVTLLIIEKLVNTLQNRNLYINHVGTYTITGISIIISLTLINLVLIDKLDINILSQITLTSSIAFKESNFYLALVNLDWIRLISETLAITFLASGIAIGLPPLLIILFPNKYAQQLLSVVWIFCRLVPTPLTLMLLLVSTTPSISVAALALGIQNMGVLGRILKENIAKQRNQIPNAIKSIGCTQRMLWLYGKLTPHSNGYLTYGAYRVDVILRETIVVGAIGGVGLGWQFKESLSSFAWEELILITLTFILISMIGEIINEKYLLSESSRPRGSTNFTTEY